MRKAALRALAAVLVMAGTWFSGAPRPVAAAGWLAQVNSYRASAGLPPVVETASLSSGDFDHSKYLVENNADGHTEDPTKPYSTPQGVAAGRQSDVMVDYKTSTSDEDAINLWMTGPFHSIAIIDPNLQSAGFGSYRAVKPAGAEQMAASLNVIAGRAGTTPPTTNLPVLWPGNGSTVPLTSYTGTESPDPLTSCAGFTAPTGLPLILETGRAAAVVTASMLTLNGQPAPACEFDASNYTNPNSQDQAEARSLLAARGAVVLIPRSPLVAGVSYTVSLTVNGTDYTWSFRAGVGGQATASAPLSTQTPRPGRQAKAAPRPPTSPPAPTPVAAPVVALASPEAHTQATPLPDAAQPAQAAPEAINAQAGPVRPHRPAATPPWWWWALGVALGGAGLSVVALATRRGRRS